MPADELRRPPPVDKQEEYPSWTKEAALETGLWSAVYLQTLPQPRK